jgi:hypothetical protein
MTKNYEIAALLIFIYGSLVALLPVKILLLFDRRYGYVIYRQTLRLTGSEEQALKKAREVYRFAGCATAAGGVIIYIVYKWASR